MKIGFVGAGRMGLPMVERLCADGHSVVVLCRSEAAEARVEAAGAQPTRAITTVTEDAAAVILCLLHDHEVRRLGDGGELVESMADHSVLINHTTGDPATMCALADRAAGRPVAMVDAPVSGGPDDIEAGAVTLFVGGEAEAKVLAGKVLSSYGSPIFDTGGLGNGQKTKLVNNALLAANIGVALDAARLGADLGLDQRALLAALPNGSSASRGLSLLASVGSADALFSAAGEFLGKDVATVCRVAQELTVDLGLIGTVIDSSTLEPLHSYSAARRS